MVKTIFYSLAALACKILFLPLENKIHIFALPCNISIYYIDKSVLVENRPLLKFIRNYIRDLSGIFSISSLVRISMMPFPALTLLFVQKSSCLYYKKKVTLWLVFSRGKKQYFTHSMHSLVKYCFYHSKMKFISLRRRVISSIYHQSLGEGGGTWVNFCWVCAAGLSKPLPHYSVFSSQFIIDPMLVTMWKYTPNPYLPEFTYP